MRLRRTAISTGASPPERYSLLSLIHIYTLNEWATAPSAAHVAVTPDEADLEALFAELAANISKTGATDIVIDEIINSDFAITSVLSPNYGSAMMVNATTLKWTIPELGVTGSESAVLEFFIRHMAQTSGTKKVNESIHYSDAEGNQVILSLIHIYTFTGMAPHFTLPYSGPVLDELAFGGKLLPAIATDDPHDYQGEQLKSYILLNAASLCYQDVMEALRQGKFLATQGPWLSVAVHDSVVYVETTPVACVRLISDSWMSCQRTGEGITALEFPIPADASYIRVEAEDEQGRTAWSSPIALR